MNRKQDRLLTPAQVWDRVEEARSLLDVFGYEYEQAHGYAFDYPDSIHRHRDRDEKEHKQERVSGGDVSDPTGSLALTHDYGRRKLMQISKRIDAGMPGLGGVKAHLVSLTKLFDDPNDEIEPLESFRTKREDSPVWREANARWELRMKTSEIERLETRIRVLKAEVKKLA